MTKPGRPAHVMNPPILEAEEIPYESSQMGQRSMLLEIEFNGEEIDRLKAGTPRPVSLTKWIKQAALEKADAEAARQSQPPIEAAD